MHWFREDFRKVLILYVSPDWAKDRGERFNAKEYVDSLEAAHVRCIQPYAKDHHGYCYYKTSLGNPYPIDVMGELTREARSRGMRVIPYFSLGFDAYTLGLHPDWLYVDSRGEPRSLRAGAFRWGCLGSPYRDFCLQQIEELVSQYEVDGLWLDILPFGPLSVEVDGRPGLSSTLLAPCYCPSCQRDFRERTGRDLPLKPSSADQVLAFQMMIDSLQSFLQEASRLTKRHHPHALVTYNGAGGPVDAIDHSDLITTEAHAPGYLKLSFRSRWGRHRDRMFEMYAPSGLPGSGIGFNAWDFKPAEILQLETAIVMSQGGVLWLSQTPYPHGGTEQAQYDTLERVFSFAKTLEPYVRDAESVSEIALATTNRPYSAPRYGHESMSGTEALHHALVHGHFQFDVLRLPTDLSRYRLVALADQSVMSEEDAEALRRFVYDGGNLLVTGATSTVDDSGQPRGDFALADVLGVNLQRHSEHPFVYLRLADQGVKRGIPDMPILVQMPSVEVEPSTGRVLAYMHYPEFKRTNVLTVIWGYPPPDAAQSHPALILNRYGKGTCIYSSVSFPHRANPWAALVRGERRTAMAAGGNALDVVWTERLIRNALDLLLPQRILDTNAPPGVEVTLNRWQESYLVHLINHQAGDPTNPCYAGDRLHLQDIKIWLNTERLGALSQASLVPSGTPLATKISGSQFEVTVPSLDIHSLVRAR